MDITIEKLQKEAESARVSGNRDVFLEIQKKITALKEKQVLDNHKSHLAIVQKEFPVGTYIPELGVRVKEIKEGCGTKEGWVYIYIEAEKYYTYWKLKKKISEAIEKKLASQYFAKLKFSDTKTLLYIGDNNIDTIERLIKVMDLDIRSLVEIDELNFDYYSDVMSSAKQAAIDDGYTDEEADKKAEEAEAKEYERSYNEYMKSVMRTLNYLLNFHDISLIEKRNRYYLQSDSWKNTANKIAETISGYGMFEYKDGKELKEMLPAKTYCEASIVHLHWLKYYPDVYGETQYQRILER